ncbi:serine/threonine-protein kinase [Dokdonella sp.]|uniref:serine/threonine-protein kinase n=1 Tax=Dokdonella sp. TaxID=2291710 RepID=UPI002F41A500
MNATPASARELFEAALALAPGKRMAWLDAQCLDGAQRAEVLRLLAADADAGERVLDEPFDHLLGRVGEVEAPPPPLPHGTVVGDYTLIERLGEGGYSVVYRAEREQAGVRQAVALKLLHRGLHTADERRRFRDERRALAQLRHPGIARLIEGGVTDAGVPYIALELVDGVPITGYVLAQRLDLHARLRLFVSVCRAVEAAHRALIVHRDLKPSNVLVTREGEVKLLDFGIAKLLDAGDEPTRTQRQAMTPAYAAPEQFALGQVTTATDVYALGVLLGELVTGQRRAPGESRTPSSHVGDDTDESLLPAPARVVRRQLRGDLDNIVLKATATEPERRYASAGAFADDIERHLAGQPVQAHPPSRWYRARKFVARHRGGVASGALFVLAILSALAIAVWQARRAEVEARRAQVQARRAEAVQAFLGDLFRANSRNQADAAKARQTTARELLDLGAQRVGNAMADVPEAKLSVLQLFAQLYDDLELADEALRVRREAVELARRVYGAASPQVADELVHLASAMQSSRSADDERKAVLDEAGRILDAEGDVDSPTRGAWLRRQAEYYWNYDPARAYDYARRAVRLFDAKPPSVDLADSLLSAGIQSLRMHEPAEATAAFARAIEIAKVVQEAAPNAVKYYAYLGEAQSQQLDLAGAERSMRAAWTMARRDSGAEHVDVLQTQLRLGGLLCDIGRTQEGLDLLRGAKQLAIRLRGADDPFHTRAALSALGRCESDVGDLGAALANAQAATAIDRRNRAGSLDLALRLEREAAVLIELGRFAPAQAELDEAVALRTQAKQPRSGDAFAANLRLQAALALARGDVARARERLAELPVAADDVAASFDRLDRRLLGAEVALGGGDAAAARAEADAAARMIARSGQSGALEAWNARAALDAGRAAALAHDTEAATTSLRQALELRRKVLLPTSPKLADAMTALASAELDRGDRAAARTLADEAAAIHATQSELGAQYRRPLRDLQARLGAE